MTAPSFNPDKYRELPPEQQPYITAEVTAELTPVVSGVYNYIVSEGRGEVAPVIQADAHELEAESVRDELIRRLSILLQADLEDQLNATEHQWESVHGVTVTVEPWMKPYLNIDSGEADEAVDMPGLRRWAKLDTYQDQDFWMHEIEVQGVYDAGEADERTSYTRMIWFGATQAQ